MYIYNITTLYRYITIHMYDYGIPYTSTAVPSSHYLSGRSSCPKWLFLRQRVVLGMVDVPVMSGLSQL